MIVALARKLLIALWRFVTTGEVPEGVTLRSRECEEPVNPENGGQESLPTIGMSSTA